MKQRIDKSNMSPGVRRGFDMKKIRFLNTCSEFLNIVAFFRHRQSGRVAYLAAMLYDFFHTNLRQARERAGITQEVLAEGIGVGRTTIVSLETGKTRLFNKNIPKVAERLGISLEELLCGIPADALLRDEPSWAEREHALIEEYEQRIQILQDKLDDAYRLNKALQDNVDSLTTSHNYLLEQLRKEQ